MLALFQSSLEIFGDEIMALLQSTIGNIQRYQPHRMGHGQHHNLNLDMDGWWAWQAVCGLAVIDLWMPVFCVIKQALCNMAVPGWINTCISVVGQAFYSLAIPGCINVWIQC